MEGHKVTVGARRHLQQVHRGGSHARQIFGHKHLHPWRHILARGSRVHLLRRLRREQRAHALLLGRVKPERVALGLAAAAVRALLRLVIVVAHADQQASGRLVVAGRAGRGWPGSELRHVLFAWDALHQVGLREPRPLGLPPLASQRLLHARHEALRLRLVPVVWPPPAQLAVAQVRAAKVERRAVHVVLARRRALLETHVLHLAQRVAAHAVPQVARREGPQHVLHCCLVHHRVLVPQVRHHAACLGGSGPAIRAQVAVAMAEASIGKGEAAADDVLAARLRARGRRLALDQSEALATQLRVHISARKVRPHRLL
mmetsp:Transcript_4071/g.13083  ORF Transcript_4071/g.13083 Transcript_4071/m.13083 type:complete len:316 (-) Transcript_4071:515-1462(-)